jgi:hypothetical protein
LRRANDIAIPIFAQRLMTNMRKVDYMGSEPYASKLLFAPANSGSETESGFDDELASSLKTVSEPPSFRHPKGGDLGGCNGNV